MLRIFVCALVLCLPQIAFCQDVEQVMLSDRVYSSDLDTNRDYRIALNKRLRELQAEHTVTRMTLSAAPRLSKVSLVVFYKAGKPDAVMEVAAIDGADSPGEHRMKKTGGEWINEFLTELQKEHRIVDAKQASTGYQGENAILLIIYTKK